MSKDFSICSNSSNLICYSLETLEKNFHDSTINFMNLARKIQINETNVEILDVYVNLMNLNVAINEKLSTLMDEFTTVNENSKDLALLDVINVFGCFFIAAVFLPIWVSMKSIVEEDHVLRKLMRFLPIGLLSFHFFFCLSFENLITSRFLFKRNHWKRCLFERFCFFTWAARFRAACVQNIEIALQVMGHCLSMLLLLLQETFLK